MDGREAVLAGKNSSAAADSAKAEKLRERLDRLLREAADVEVELSRADGTIKGVPHYSLIEGRAHELGKQLSREVQQRQMNELAASHATMAKCPQCGTRCALRPQNRTVKSVDGDTTLQELVGDCPRCRRSFFPDTRAAGL
jgi:DNA-directed RNA polymerase subunit RPC12/RpoP